MYDKIWRMAMAVLQAGGNPTVLEADAATMDMIKADLRGWQISQDGEHILTGWGKLKMEIGRFSKPGDIYLR